MCGNDYILNMKYFTDHINKTPNLNFESGQGRSETPSKSLHPMERILPIHHWIISNYLNNIYEN